MSSKLLRFTTANPHTTIVPYLSPPSEVYDSPGQAAHYHILGLCVGGFVPDLAIGWLQSKKERVSFLPQSTNPTRTEFL
jgi:hypothetical protein